MWFCGIDWAEKHLDFCLETETGDVVERSRIDNTEDGFSTMIQTCQQHIKVTDIAVAIESPHEPVVDFLLARSITVYPVNPSAIDQYRKSQKVSGSKSLVSTRVMENKNLRRKEVKTCHAVFLISKLGKKRMIWR